jgi:hypothetical protein
MQQHLTQNLSARFRKNVVVVVVKSAGIIMHHLLKGLRKRSSVQQNRSSEAGRTTDQSISISLTF